jgi:hypothetical protein
MIKQAKMFNLHVTLHSFLKRMAAFLLLITLLSCSRDTLRVTGQVLRVSGNQMPSPDLPEPVFPGFSTGIYFFEPVQVSAATRTGQEGVYSSVNARLIKQARSDARGRFSVRLKPGRYSVLIGKDSLFYANIRDGKGFLNPMEISPDNRSGIVLRADWGAYY